MARPWLLLALIALVACGCVRVVEKQVSGGSATSAMTPEESDALHLVRVHIPLKGGNMGSQEERERYTALEDVLDAAAQDNSVGSLDGNEIGGDEYTIWLYGSDGKKLAAVVRKALAKAKLPKGSKIYIRHGGVEDEKARKETIRLP